MNEFESINKRVHVDPNYERYLFNERQEALKKIEKEKWIFDLISIKIRKEVPLSNGEVQEWTRKNFFNFTDEEQEDILYWFRRRNNMRIFLLITWPISQIPVYTYLKKYKGFKNLASITLSTIFVFIPAMLLNYLPQRRLNESYRRTFASYKTLLVPIREREKLAESDKYKMPKFEELKAFIQNNSK